MKKICLGCGMEFETDIKRTRYHDAKCKGRANARRRRAEVKENTNNARISRYPKIAKKKNKKGEYASPSTKSCWDYWQG